MNRVLVVEDDPSISQVMTEVLQELDCAVDTARNGAEALEKVRSEPLPDVVVLNVRMPVMDGETFLETWRDEEGPSASVPVVLATAARDGQAIAERVGAEAFLPKPFDIDDLLEVVEQVGSDSATADAG